MCLNIHNTQQSTKRTDRDNSYFTKGNHEFPPRSFIAVTKVQQTVPGGELTLMQVVFVAKKMDSCYYREANDVEKNLWYCEHHGVL